MGNIVILLARITEIDIVPYSVLCYDVQDYQRSILVNIERLTE